MNKFFIEQITAHPKTWVFASFGAGVGAVFLARILFGGLLGL